MIKNKHRHAQSQTDNPVAEPRYIFGEDDCLGVIRVVRALDRHRVSSGDMVYR